MVLLPLLQQATATIAAIHLRAAAAVVMENEDEVEKVRVIKEEISDNDQSLRPLAAEELLGAAVVWI
jgi:hypothetical protein